MANKFLSKKIITSAIVFGGILIASGVLISANFTAAKLPVTQSSEWTQNVGAGIAAPACSSATSAVSCSGSNPLVTFSWLYGGLYNHGFLCATNNPSLGNQGVTGLPCDGSYTFSSGLSNNTTYHWTMDWRDADNVQIDSLTGDVTTPNCNPGTVGARATLDGATWLSPPDIVIDAVTPSGPLTNYSVTIPFDFTNQPTGDYSVTYKSGGPPNANFSNITPTSTQTLSAGSAIVFTFNFITPPPASFDYNLASSGDINIVQGQSGSNTITATLVSGTTQGVSFSASGLPSGATASFSPALCNPNCSTVLSISTLASTPTGTYPITITGNPLNKSTTFNLVVNAVSPPGDFTLNPPTVACNSVSLSWTPSAGADGYRVLRGSPRVDISPYQPYTALNFNDASVSQNTGYLYQIEAYNGAGTNRSNIKNVTTPYCPPTLSFSGSPLSIYQGQSSILTWSTTYVNLNGCTASGAWNGGKAASGNETVFPSPPPSATYNLSCTGPGGTVTQSVTINITALALPDWKEIIPR